jgi:ketosteroid isomerase-like protein
MPNDFLELARRVFDAGRGGDVEAVLSACHPEIELHLLGPVEEPVHYKGHDGVRQMLRDMAASWESFEAIGEDFRAVGGRIVVLGRQRNVGRASGVAIETPRGWLIDVLDGKPSRSVPTTRHRRRSRPRGWTSRREDAGEEARAPASPTSSASRG